MNLLQRQEAYRAIKERHNLRADQRDKLDASSKLAELLQLAHDKRWYYVDVLVESEGILDTEEELLRRQRS